MLRGQIASVLMSLQCVLAVEALSPSQNGRGIARSSRWRHATCMLNDATTALLDVLLEAR